MANQTNKNKIVESLYRGGRFLADKKDKNNNIKATMSATKELRRIKKSKSAKDNPGKVSDLVRTIRNASADRLNSKFGRKTKSRMGAVPSNKAKARAFSVGSLGEEYQDRIISNLLNEDRVDEFLPALAGLAGRALMRMGTMGANLGSKAAGGALNMAQKGQQMKAGADAQVHKKKNIASTMQTTNRLRTSLRNKNANPLQQKSDVRTLRNNAIDRINQRRMAKNPKAQLMQKQRNIPNKDTVSRWKNLAKYEEVLQQMEQVLTEVKTNESTN